jgi:hypothetical protein
MKAYRFIAYLIAVEVVVQASAIAFALFGLGKWIEDDNGVLNKAVLDADKGPDFTGALGFAIHGINGTMVIPVLALIFLIVSFFAKVPSGTKWASIVLLLVIVQVALGMTAHSVPALGPLHASNAFAILGVAAYAGKHATAAPADAAPAAA